MNVNCNCLRSLNNCLYRNQAFLSMWSVNLAKQLDNSKNRTKSSHEWLTRQLNDSYLKRAKIENFRARSAFKLNEIDDRYRLLHPGQLVVDCGAAPGSWSQVASGRVNARKIDRTLDVGKVIAIDLNYIAPIEGVIVVPQADFTSPSVQQSVIEHFDGRHPDVLLSDMAPNATGVRSMDHENIMLLATTALTFAVKTLNVGGHFICKVWDGCDTKNLESIIDRFFETTRRVKPDASRSDSAEVFLLGYNFKGRKSNQ